MTKATPDGSPRISVPSRERPAGQRHGIGGGHSGAGIVVGERGEQQLLADGRVGELAAEAVEPPARLVVMRGNEEIVGDQPRLEHAAELGVGAGELLERAGEGRVGFVALQAEELTA